MIIITMHFLQTVLSCDQSVMFNRCYDCDGKRLNTLDGGVCNDDDGGGGGVLSNNVLNIIISLIRTCHVC